MKPGFRRSRKKVLPHDVERNDWHERNRLKIGLQSPEKTAHSD